MDEQEAIDQLLGIIESYQVRYEFILSNPEVEMIDLFDNLLDLPLGKL